MVQLLVHRHAAIDQPCDVSNALYNSSTSSLLSCLPQSEFAATPLMAASDKNHLEVTMFLISNGADVNRQTKVFDNVLFS